MYMNTPGHMSVTYISYESGLQLSQHQNIFSIADQGKVLSLAPGEFKQAGTDDI